MADLLESGGMTVAFGFANTLADFGARRERRYFHMRDLWTALHKAGHRMLIVSYVEGGKGTTGGPEKRAKRREEIDYVFEHYHLPKPHGIFVVSTPKPEVLEVERVDLFIDDMKSWTDQANAKHVTSLRLI